MNDFKVFGGIVAHTLAEFETAFAKVSEVVDGVHVDFVDGEFAPNITVSLDELPVLNKYFGEAHLMVYDPVKYLPKLAEKGFRKVIVHKRSLPEQSERLLQLLVEYAKSLNLMVYVAVELGEELPVASELRLVDGVMMMGVSVGFAGGEFNVESLNRVKYLREWFPGLLIEFDGGVSDLTIGQIKQCGTNEVVSTSYLQKAELVLVAVNKLKEA